MAATALVKNAYPGVNPEKCMKCGYFLKYLPWMKANENGLYSGVCICAKTGKGTGPVCQDSS
ncbi:MAG: hypothetical protein WC619_00950 [Patescibacteria group bacterium]